jgi:tRNA(adenine34) deaminase
MQRAIQLAEAARQAGNVPVGALVVWEEQAIAEGSETLPQGLDVTGHAELIAIRGACEALASRNLQGCTLYTTAEPCWMCSYAIRDTGISTVVIGAATTDVGGISTRYPLLVDADLPVWGSPPRIIFGMLHEACAALRQ